MVAGWRRSAALHVERHGLLGAAAAEAHERGARLALRRALARVLVARLVLHQVLVARALLATVLAIHLELSALQRS